jgi:hypothetical protein
MNASVVGVIAFASTFGAALIGTRLRTLLPQQYFDTESRDTVKVGIGLIATMTALVLGLVTASAKSSFDSVSTAVKAFATETLALDRTLARYGSETDGIRKDLQRLIGTRIDMIWPEDSSKPVSLDPVRMSAGEEIARAIRDLNPTDNSQRALQAQALDLAEGLLHSRWLVTTSTGASVPLPFLAVLLFWLTITFASFGLFAPRNAMVVTVLFVCAVSVASALFLVLEMDGPFEGLLTVSADPLRSAYARLNQ